LINSSFVINLTFLLRYGSDPQQAMNLREGVGGRMKTTMMGKFPPQFCEQLGVELETVGNRYLDEDKLFCAGDRRFADLFHILF